MFEIIKDNTTSPVSYPSLGIYKGPNGIYRGMEVIFWSMSKQTVLKKTGAYAQGENVSGFNISEFDLFDFKISY